MSLKTQISGVVRADEVSALKSKYDEELNRQDYMNYVVAPGLLVAGYAIATTYFWWLGVIGFIVGAFYGFKKILPAIVEQDYFYNSLVERDTFTINMTQILSDPTRTMSSALARSVERARGELKQDLLVLQANITGSNREQVVEAFDVLRQKYSQDISFCQYLEQMETNYLEGGSGIDALSEIQAQHGDLLKKQYDFQKQKDDAWKGVKRMVMLSFAIIFVLEFSFGFKVSFEAFCRSIPGWITSAIYVGIMLANLNSFRKNYFDNDIMSIKRKVK